ncbi:MAG: DUF547 domain-containing protein [Chitinivibrionales bacterium]|nr:DUF547 domain-containing protein [Chitinivibrionales bacterium]
MYVKLDDYAIWIKWVSIVCGVISLFIIMLHLPMRTISERLGDFVQGLGIWGMIIFVVVYIGATVMLAPGSALTLAGGLIYGLVWGTILVSIASTTAAAVAFLIARYAARDRVVRMAQQHPRFAAIDKAINDGGWKIVALLRLSPAIPFNLQNYLYGLTPIDFKTCIATSWLFMLPGTFMYVYLGYLARAGVAATAEGRTAGAGIWALRIAGFIATVAVTVYITRLAGKALAGKTEIQKSEQSKAHPPAVKKTPHWKLLFYAVPALILMLFAGITLAEPSVVRGPVKWLVSLFGPPDVTMKEAYAPKPQGPSFDHSLFDSLLQVHVDKKGLVDYQALAQQPEPLRRYIRQIGEAPFDAMGRNEKLALLINAYNAFTLQLILEYLPLESIRDIPQDKRWKDQRWRIGSHTWSLDQIEHEQIRPKFKEPRIHFALVCAAIGCPILRQEAYRASRIDDQLEAQAVYTHNHPRWFRYPSDDESVFLTKLYQWYEGDFEQIAGSALQYAARYSRKLKQSLKKGKTPDIQWLEYDWRLNSRQNKNLLEKQ